MSDRRPIAEVLLHYAGLDPARIQKMDPGELESRVQLAALVWNAVLLGTEEESEARARGDDPDAAFEDVIARLIGDIASGLGGSAGEFETMVHYLVVRKQEHFMADDRGIAQVEVARGADGRMKVTAQAL